jgi:hypothetical protein
MNKNYNKKIDYRFGDRLTQIEIAIKIRFDPTALVSESPNNQHIFLI